MTNTRRPLLATLLRSLRLRCPVCGKSSIIRTPFKIRHHCPTCDALFMREDGFFVGAILINVVTTEVVIMIIYLVSITAFSADYRIVLTILFIAGLMFPVVFYHHSWSLWLGLDHIIESLPKAAARSGKEMPRRDDDWPDRLDT